MQDLVIKQNAKPEEIKAYNILKEYLFNGKKTIIGDSFEKKLPDIYTEDLSIGVEVTSCEHISQYLKEANKKYPIKKDYGRIINAYDKLSLKDKNLLFNDEFEEVLSKKIKKISFYKNCKSINLIIISDNEDKHFIRRDSLSSIYEKLVEKYSKKYDNLFLFLNDTLYLDINYRFVKIKKYKKNEDEYGNKEYSF